MKKSVFQTIVKELDYESTLSNVCKKLEKIILNNDIEYEKINNANYSR